MGCGTCVSTKYNCDFDKTKKQIEGIEKDLGQLRSNLNAIYGAVQQTEKLLKLSKEKENEKV
jgi:hypothetical protein